MRDMYVAIDGMPVRSYGCLDRGIKWSGRHGEGPCGPDVASCVIDVDPANDSSWLRMGRVFEVFEDGLKVFGGTISEVGRGYPREVHAKSWSRRVQPGATVSGDRWGRTVDNVAFTPTDPTTPTWFLDASDLDIGVADDGLYTQVVATYVSAYTAGPPEVTTTSTVTVDDAVAQAFYNEVVPYAMDLTALGVISSGTATTYANRQLAEFTIPQWLSRASVNSQRLLSPGGLPAHLPSVRAGQMVQLFNVPNNLGGIRNELSQTVILGEVEHDQDNPTEISIAPTRLAVRNLVDALTAAAQASAA